MKPWERLPPALWDTPRARMVWKVLGIGLLVALPLSLEVWSWFSKSQNTRLSEVLGSIQAERATLAERKTRSQGIAGRYAKKAPALGGMLEQEAKKAEVQLTDSVDRPEVAIGKMYVERHTVVHVKKAGIVPVLMFVEGIEQTGYPLSIARLSLRKRSGEPDAYDVELGVSAYDRNAAAAPAKEPAKGESKDKP